MKTVKEVAQELDVSDVTIYAHLKKNERELQNNVFKKQGVTHINGKGVYTLKVSLGIIKASPIKEVLSYEDIINDVSNNISKDIKSMEASNKDSTRKLRSDIKDDNEILRAELKKDIRLELEEVKKQNEALLKMLEDRKNKSLLDKFKDLFKYE